MNRSTGQIIKGYELRESVGAGGFGEVYRAYQTAVSREVAIKVIFPNTPISRSLFAVLKSRPNWSRVLNIPILFPYMITGVIRKARTWSCVGCQ